MGCSGYKFDYSATAGLVAIPPILCPVRAVLCCCDRRSDDQRSQGQARCYSSKQMAATEFWLTSDRVGFPTKGLHCLAGAAMVQPKLEVRLKYAKVFVAITKNSIVPETVQVLTLT